MNLKQHAADPSNYQKGRTQPIQYIVIHYTANDGDTDEGNGIYFSKPNRGASAHYFVDEDSVTQSVKEKDTAWHCGTKGTYYHNKCRNANSIGVEMCSEKDGNGAYHLNEETICNTVELVRMLMEKYQIRLDHVVRHYDVTHKFCPEPFVRRPEDWKHFKERLKEEKKSMEKKKYQTVEQLPEWGKETIRRLVEKGCFADEKKLDLSEEMVRIFVIHDRMGLYH